MRRSVYLRSTLRQPVKTIFLLLLVGVISFTFLVRGLECALVYRETDRLGSYYRSIASLVPLEGDPDRTDVTDYLETLPEVKLVNRTRRTSGIQPPGHYNADLDGSAFPSDVAPPETVAVSPTNVVFYGILQKSSMVVHGYSINDDWDGRILAFEVDKVVLGYPEYVSPGKQVWLMGYDGTPDFFDELEPGKRYLVRGYYDTNVDYNFCFTYKDNSHYRFMLVPVRPEEQIYVVEAEEDVDLTAPEYAKLAEDIRLADENLRGLYICAVADASSRPDTQESSRTEYLVEGRWPDAEDNAQGRRVCSIDQGLAQCRGLKLGDTLEVELLNVHSDLGYSGYDLDAIQNHFTVPRQKERYEIVGIHRRYPTWDGYYFSMYSNFVYVPLSTFPQDFALTYSTDNTADSFELDSPDGKDGFLARHKDALAQMGFQASFLENGWDNFTAAAEPMQRSALYNAVLFGIILLMALCLAVFAYFRFRRKEAVISRALGDGAAKCVWGISAPMLLLGLVGIGSGGALAWRYVSGHMETLLSGLEGYEEGAATLPLWMVFAFCGGVLLLLMVVTLLFAIFLMKKPVLALLQGGGPQAKAQKTAPTAPIPAFSGGSRGPAVEFAPSLAAPTPGARGWRYTLRFVRRHILRAPLKSLLALLLAGVFLVGLAAIQVTLRRDKAELDTLYQTIEVDVEITKARPGDFTRLGYIGKTAVRALLESEYVKDHYLEAVMEVSLSKEDATGVVGDMADKITIYGLEDFDTFAREHGGGSIEYAAHRGNYIFSAPEGTLTSSVVVLPRSLADHHATYLRLTNKQCTLGGYRVAGYFDGLDQNSALMPLSKVTAYSGMYPYVKARFTLDPARNRELDDFLALVDQTLTLRTAGAVELTAVVWDQELKQVIEPLEQSIAFMEILYPITVALSLIVSAGAALLLVILSSRESAILRVLGTEKRRVMAALCLQTVIPCVIGLLAGFAVTQLYIGTALGSAKELLLPTLAQAGGYLLAALAAATVTAAALSKRNPLTALQAKE